MTQELRERIAGRRVVASVSGGKDSAALSLWLTEQGIEHDRVFMDTGWEAKWTYEYLAGELPRVIGKITTIKAPLQMEELIRKKGMFASRLRRFCTEELKVFPMQRYLNQLVDNGEDLINAVGIRRDESAARAATAEWEWSAGFDCEVWRPLVSWTMQDVVDIHHRHGLLPNPLYLKGATRVGCWPCIHANKEEIALMAQIDQERISRLMGLEAWVKEKARERYERDREAWLARPDPEPTVDDKQKRERWEKKRDRLMAPFVPPTWFQASTRDKDGKRPCVPIDEVVEWARSDRHGQVNLFGPADSDTGCMRWGLCETHGNDNNQDSSQSATTGREGK